MATSRLYYDPTKPTAFSTFQNSVNSKKESKQIGDIRTWLGKQDPYTLHRPVRKRFARNPYSVNNVMNIWEFNLSDVRALGKFSDIRVHIFQISTSGPSKVQDRYRSGVSMSVNFQALQLCQTSSRLGANE